uniref:CPG4 domain-containing protein n=1 Tax=Globodera pallida TaxID=36090 RepID=A0A183BNA8_GLOPA
MPETVTPFGHHNAAASMPCLVDACTSQYRHSLEDIGSDGPSATVQYCLLLKNYRQCLNDSFRHCLAQLDFHSATTTAARRWHRFECDRLIINAVPDEHRATAQAKCYAPKLEEDDYGEEENDVDDADSAEDYYYDDDENNSRHGSEEIDGTQKTGKMPTVCAMFGQLHLRPFHATTSSQIDQCSFVGARPFVDNPFFLIQITASDLLMINSSSSGSTKKDQLKTKMLGITNIALIIRPKKGCVHDQKLYLADSGDQNALPPTFVDGTTNSGTEINGKKQAVEIVQKTAESVRISLNYVDTEILIQNFGNRFFNIFVRLQSPKLLQSHFVSSAAAVGHLCGQSCQAGLKFPENQAFLNRNGQINELCSKLVDRLSAKQSANNASRHNWISAICARDLARAPTAMHFPMELWLNSLFFAAEELDDEHGQFFNNKNGLIKKDKEDLATYDDDQESNAGRPKPSSDKNLNNDGTNAVFHTVPTFRASSPEIRYIPATHNWSSLKFTPPPLKLVYYLYKYLELYNSV